MLTSEPQREISEDTRVGNGCDEDNDDRHPETATAASHTCRNESDKRAIKQDFMAAKVKQALLFPFAKFRNKKQKKKQTKSNVKFSSLSYSGKRVDSVAGGGACRGFCCVQPCTLDLVSESQTSDPNDASFTYDMLKALIESNHFYSKECNPHTEFSISDTM